MGTMSAVVAVMIVVGDLTMAGMTRCTILWIVVIHDRLRVKIKVGMMRQRLG